MSSAAKPADAKREQSKSSFSADVADIVRGSALRDFKFFSSFRAPINDAPARQTASVY
jgi:hypothetical protein